MKRSSNYDFFINNPNDNGFKKKTFKEKLKYIWKFTRVAIYLFLAALALTGCIQSFVLKTSSTVGSGIELYNSKSDIAPYVNNYKLESIEVKVLEYDANGQIKLDENGKPVYKKVNSNKLKSLPKENYLVSNSTIKKLKEQLDAQYGKEIGDRYGVYNNHSSSLRIVGLDNLSIGDTTKQLYGSVENNELVSGSETHNFLFMNNKILNELSSQGRSYQVQNKWQDINFFVLRKPQNFDNLSSYEKKSYGNGITNINGAFQPFEVVNKDGGNLITPIPIKIQNGKFYTYDANWDGINDSNELVEIKNPNRINKFKYAFDAEVVSVSTEQQGLFNSEKYARDYLQSLSNVVIQFNQLNPFFEKVLNVSNAQDPESRFNAASKTKLEQLFVKHDETPLNNSKNNLHIPSSISNQRIDVNKLLSVEQKNAILTYQNEIFSLVNGLGFGIRPQIYEGDSEDKVNWTDPYFVEYMPFTKNKKDLLLGAAYEPQKPIYSWGGAWELGPFYGLVVWPLAFIINGISGSMPPLNGWAAIIAIVLAILISRIFTTALTYKTVFSSHKQQELAPKKAKIDAKYEGFKGNKQMEAKKRQEISDLYKKHNVSLTGPLLSMLITMPVFLAVWRVVQGIPDIKSATWLGIQLSATSWRELFNGSWQYLPLLLIAIVVQVASHLLPRYLNKKRLGERANVAEKEALKKANKSQNIMMIVFVVMAVIFEAGVQIYWIIGGLWQIGQTLIVHQIVKTEFYRTKLSKYV